MNCHKLPMNCSKIFPYLNTIRNSIIRVSCFHCHELENSRIFPSFCECLGTFQASLYTKNVFLFLFPKRSGFLFSSHFADISDCKS